MQVPLCLTERQAAGLFSAEEVHRLHDVGVDQQHAHSHQQGGHHVGHGKQLGDVEAAHPGHEQAGRDDLCPRRWLGAAAGCVEMLGDRFLGTIDANPGHTELFAQKSGARRYAMMFTGKPQSLKKRLGTISPSPSQRVDLP